MDARTSRYPEVYARWQRDPLGFWGEAAADIDWFEPPKAVFDPAAGVYGHWFPGAVCNTCYNAIDRHVLAGRANQPAIIYDSPVTGLKQTITYAALQTKTETLAGILKHHFGVQKGDRILFGKYSGSEIRIDGEELMIMREDEVLGVLEGAPKKATKVA